MTNTNSTTSTPRCQFQFSDGRNCRMLRSPAHSTFCIFHAREELQLLESQSLGAEISTSLHGDFLTATDINHVLGKLFIAVAQDRVPLRKALALTYMGQVMLTSLPHVKKEFPFSYKFDQWTKALDHAAPLSPLPSSRTPRSGLPRGRMTLHRGWSPNGDCPWMAAGTFSVTALIRHLRREKPRIVSATSV